MAHFLIYLLVWLNPNQSNRMSAAQWCFPLQSKWGFSGITVKRKLLQGLLVSIRELQFAPVERQASLVAPPECDQIWQKIFRLFMQYLA